LNPIGVGDLWWLPLRCGGGLVGALG